MMPLVTRHDPDAVGRRFHMATGMPSGSFFERSKPRVAVSGQVEVGGLKLPELDLTHIYGFGRLRSFARGCFEGATSGFISSPV